MYRENGREMEMVVRHAKAGDESCRQELAEMVRFRIWRYFYRVTRDEDAMADMVQDTLVRMIGGLDRLRDDSRFWPWVYRIARNRCRDYLRRKQREDTVNFSTIDEYCLEGALTDKTPCPENWATNNEISGALRLAVKKLNGKSRDVVALRCAGLSYLEIGESVGCSESSARVLFMRAKQTIGGYLANMGFCDKIGA